jgi:hypothetical protein
MYGPRRIFNRGNGILKAVGNCAQAAKRSFWSLQRRALERPRQTLAGQAAIRGRIVDFDQRCASGGRPECGLVQQSWVARQQVLFNTMFENS